MTRNGAILDGDVPAISLQKLVSIDGGHTFTAAPAPPGAELPAGTNPVYNFVVTNTGGVTLTGITLEDTDFGVITSGATLEPGHSFTEMRTGTFALGEHCDTAVVKGAAGTQIVTADSTVCLVGGSGPAIQLTKLLSVDGGHTFEPASQSPGPELVSPQVPLYRFEVKNIGAVTLTDLLLEDTTFGPIALPVTTLGAGHGFTVSMTGAFAEGEQCNSAAVAGVASTQVVTDGSTACYTGVLTPETAIRVRKELSVDGGLNFSTAPTPPGPTLVSPTNPLYRFVVTNSGTAHIVGITLVDSTLGPIATPTTVLGPGQSFTTAPVPGAIAPGEHCNVVTATGTYLGQPVTATSTACFFGVAAPESCLQIAKLISVHGLCGPFVAAPTPPGITLLSPGNPAFRFVVTNTCGATVNHIALVDTVLGPITIPTTVLGPGESFTVTVCGAFSPGLHCNTATVSGFIHGRPVTGSSTACFFGIASPVPVFPDISGPAPQPQIIDRLLETVALEELALAALINAEAEKVQAVARAGVTGPLQPDELVAINQAVAAVIARAAEKESLLQRKLSRVLSHKERCIAPCPA